jgi:hypothetical protein
LIPNEFRNFGYNYSNGGLKYMAIAIQNLQNPAIDEVDFLEELDSKLSDRVSGGFLLYLGAFLAGCATGTALVSAAGVGYIAGNVIASEMSNGFVPGPNGEGCTSYGRPIVL